MNTSYREIIKALVPQAKRLAEIFGDEGITASNVRRVGLKFGIIAENTPLHFLSSVMRQAGLWTDGRTRASSIPSTKGRRQLIWYPAVTTPYAD